MRKLLVLAVTACIVAGSLSSSLAQDQEIQVLLDRAITAQGGEKALANLKAAYSKAKGTISLMDMDLSLTAESFFQTPGKIRAVIQLEIQNMNLSVIQVFDGKQGWVNAMGKTMDLDDKAIAEIKDALYVEHVMQLVPLRDKSFKLSALGDFKVEGKACVGVQVTQKGQKDVNLYFDKANYLLVKADYRGTDPISKQEVNQEKFFSEYKVQAGGLKLPTKVTVNNDGKKFMQMEVTEFRLVESHDASLFARP